MRSVGRWPDRASVCSAGRPRWATALLLLGALAAPALPALAQSVSPPSELPNTRRLDAPSPGETADGEPILETPAPSISATEAGPSILVRRIRIDGNTLLQEAEIVSLVARYVDRTNDAADLDRLRGDLSRLYFEAGYVGTQAFIPDQDFEDGLLVVRVVEATLAAVEISGENGFRERYLKSRLAPESGKIVDVHAIERRLQILRRDPRIMALRAELRPGHEAGQSILRVQVLEARRYGARLDIDDYQSPAIGEVNGRIGAVFENPTGWGDGVFANAGFSEGMADIELRYGIPLTRYDTRLDVRGRYSATKIVEDVFEGLDVQTRYWAVGLSLAQPVYRTAEASIELGIRGEYRDSRSTVDGFGFAFSDAARDGRVRVAVLRFFQDATHQTRNQVLAARSTFSVGIETLGARSGLIDQADFVAWLGQLQWVRRFEPTGMELMVRGDVQLAFDSLVPFERFSVGGRYSVRGYRQNQTVTDSGFSIGFEARYPVLRKPSGAPILQIVPFVDVGRGWNHGRGGVPEPQNMAGAGVGLVWHPTSWLRAELFYGSDIWDVAEHGDESLQDRGIYFQLSAFSF
jgi:hemolysin activation/secretion protein